MKKLYIILAISLLLPLGKTGLFSQNVNIPDANFKAALVGNASINTNLDTEIQVSEAAAFTDTIDVTNLGIADLTGIEAFSALTYLDCSYNTLTSVNLSANTALNILGCSANLLTSLDVSANTSLTLLQCNINNITSLDLSANTSLTYLNCGWNLLTSLNVSANTALYLLDCQFNQLTGLNVSANTALTDLICIGNLLTCLNVKNGNNTGILSFYATNNPNLGCIQVDDYIYSTAYWTGIDAAASFSIDCGQPIASFTSNAPICLGGPVNFTDQSGASSSWFWNFGDGDTSMLQYPSHAYLSSGNFPVMLTAGNCYGSATDTATATITVTPGPDILGHVSYSGGNVTNGVAIIYPYNAFYATFDTLQIQPLDAFGNYIFTNVPQGDYLIKIYPDTLVYPDTLTSTYFNYKWVWDSATVITHGCINNDTVNVVMIELNLGGGFGLFNGQIIEGYGFGRAFGDPIPGIDVKLGITGSSQLAGFTTTDANGYYTFSNLDFGTYTVYVDIPGLERVSYYTFTVDAVNNQFLGLDYGVDSVSIYILNTTGINTISTDQNKFNVFPNPFLENTTIAYSLNSDAFVKLDVYNVVGIKVQSLVNTQQQSGDYQINFNVQNNNLKAGLYFISLSVNGKTSTRRIVVME